MKKTSKISIMFFSLSLLFLFSGYVSAAPYPQSDLFSGINWDQGTLKRTAYGSDNFPTTWSDDGFIYTLYQDGGGFDGNDNDICRVDLGVARISGSGSAPSYDDYWGYGGSCSNYKVTFGGKSYGIVSVGGTLHMLVGGKSGMIGDPDFLAPGGWGGSCWDAMSVTRIASSYDHGASWSLTGSDFFSYQNGVGYPSFLQYGKDYAGNTDGYLYVYSADVSGGASGHPTKITLLRVPKGEVRTASSYRYYTGTGWSSNSSDRQSIFTDTTNGVGLPSAIYHSGLGRYILVVPHGTAKAGDCLGGGGEGGLGIFEGPNPWGPWKTIYYKDNWLGSNNMFYANIPTKWISGNDFYLIFTGHDPDPVAQDAYQHIKGTITLASTATPGGYNPDAIPACHLYSSSNAVPTGFGASYNVLSTVKELLMKVFCGSNYADVQIGNGSNLQYIYNKGYIYKSGSWQIINYSCSNLINNLWCVGNANTTINLNSTEIANTNFVVSYICNWTDSQWKCGCRDSTCATQPGQSYGYWNLQAFKK